ncbi:MAG: hypothetical protein ACE368_23410 [Paracoccaceae bacterium]
MFTAPGMVPPAYQSGVRLSTTVFSGVGQHLEQFQFADRRHARRGLHRLDTERRTRPRGARPLAAQLVCGVGNPHDLDRAAAGGHRHARNAGRDVDLCLRGKGHDGQAEQEQE